MSKMQMTAIVKILLDTTWLHINRSYPAQVRQTSKQPLGTYAHLFVGFNMKSFAKWTKKAKTIETPIGIMAKNYRARNCIPKRIQIVFDVTC